MSFRNTLSIGIGGVNWVISKSVFSGAVCDNVGTAQDSWLSPGQLQCDTPVCKSNVCCLWVFVCEPLASTLGLRFLPRKYWVKLRLLWLSWRCLWFNCHSFFKRLPRLRDGDDCGWHLWFLAVFSKGHCSPMQETKTLCCALANLKLTPFTTEDHCKYHLFLSPVQDALKKSSPYGAATPKKD